MEVDVDRITILPPSLPIFFPTHNSLFNTSDSLFEISVCRKLVSMPFSSLDIGRLEKSFPESIM